MPLHYLLVNIVNCEVFQTKLFLKCNDCLIKTKDLISSQEMVITCSAPGCFAKKDNVNAKTSVQFHRFPLRKPDVLAKWVKAMKNPNFKPTVKSYLCSAHFSASDYEIRPTSAEKHLKSNAVPNIIEKKRPGRKKKIVSENKSTEDIKENEGDICKLEAEESAQEEYLEVSSTEKESNLTDIIGNQEKETVQILIVGEDGKITNSKYILKKQLFSVDDIKDPITGGSEEIRNQDTDEEGENEIKKKLDHKFEEGKISDSSEISLLKYQDLRNREKIKNLENNLMATRKQVQMLSSKCQKMHKKITSLKVLLKLLVLKRGRGEKNLKQLFEDYGKQLEICNVKIKEETNF